MKNKLPKFTSKSDEQAFWDVHDSTDYIDWKTAKKAVFPNLRPTTQSISIRLPLFLLSHIKTLAHKKDVPYQSLIKLFLQEKVGQLEQKELRG